MDVASGWCRFPVDGSETQRRRSPFGPDFDAVTVSPSGDLLALVTSTGTEGLILDTGTRRTVREISRSDYQAGAYRYPVALFTLPGGRTGLVHCPNCYNRLEVEDGVTGEPVGTVRMREPADFFHSRLAVSADGRQLLSAGWVWSPWSSLAVYDLASALADPSRLDGVGDIYSMIGMISAEVSGACFVDGGVVVSTTDEPNDPDGPDDLRPTVIARRSFDERRFLWVRQLVEPAGDLVALPAGILALHGHPRLYDADDGALLAEWPDLSTGTADSSIVWSRSFSGPTRVAVDAGRSRFAVTDGSRITVIGLSR